MKAKNADSLMYEVKTEDFYKDISEDVRERFDTSHFPQNHPSGILRMNKKVPGMFKDECGGEIISEFVGLRAKLYAYKKDGNEEKCCKGIKKAVVSTSIHLEDHKRCLFTGKDELRKINVIRSRGHELLTEEINKIALSSSDHKRIICENKIDTMAYSAVASPKIWGGEKFWGSKMFDFQRIALFCLEKCLSRHNMTIFSKNLGGHGPFGYAYDDIWFQGLKDPGEKGPGEHEVNTRGPGKGQGDLAKDKGFRQRQRPHASAERVLVTSSTAGKS